MDLTTQDALTDLVYQADGPQDEWWEHAVVGAVLQGFNDLPVLKRIIDRNDFARPMWGYLWQLIVEIDADGETPTVAMLISRLGKNVHRLPNGPVFLSTLAYSTEIAAFQAEYYAQKLRDCSLRRQAAQMGVRLVQATQDPNLEPDRILAFNQDWMDKIRERQQLGTGYIKSPFEMVLDTAENGEKGAPSTAWTDLDSIITGWYPGAVTIKAARPGVGKSIFLENSCVDLVRRHRQHVLLISVEMSAYEITQRTLAHTAGVNLTAIRNGKHNLSERDWQRIAKATPQMQADQEFFTIAAGPHSLFDIKAAVVQAVRRAHKAGSRLGMFAVDYIQRTRPRDARMSGQEHISEVIDGIKDLAQQYDTNALVAAQLNRNPEARGGDKRPQASDLRGSGTLEQTADNIILGHEEEIEINGKKQWSGEVDLIVAKQRNGPTGVRTLQKMGEYAKLVQMTTLAPPTPLRAVRD